MIRIVSRKDCAVSDKSDIPLDNRSCARCLRPVRILQKERSNYTLTECLHKRDGEDMTFSHERERERERERFFNKSYNKRRSNIRTIIETDDSDGHFKSTRCLPLPAKTEMPIVMHRSWVSVRKDISVGSLLHRYCIRCNSFSLYNLRLYNDTLHAYCTRYLVK